MSAKLEVDIIAQLKDFNKAISDLNGKVDEMGKKFDKRNKKNKASFTDFKKGIVDDIKSIALSFVAFDAVFNFGKKIVDTTSEFQKMAAVLGVSLGGKSQAQAAMNQIVDFASQTPFQVNELTDSFVKLANRGFIPTMNQMRKMGDLASSVGKSFDQLTEAILDAQTGEFERLKEFGINASSAGDKVIFTFKGITTEVQKSDAAIQDYILSLGDLEGVAGAMKAISKTTGGVISNLSDNITSLFEEIGDSSTGFINWFLKDLNKVITQIRFFSEFVEGLNPFTDISEKSEEFRRYLLRASDALTETGVSFKDFASTFDSVDLKKLLGDTSYRDLFIQSLQDEGESLKNAQSLWKSYINIRKDDFNAEQLLAASKKNTASETQKLTQAELDRAEKEKKAHQERIKRLRAEQSEYIKNTQISVRGMTQRDPFNPQTVNIAEKVSPDRLVMIQNATGRIIQLNKELAKTIPGITPGEDAIQRQQLYLANQQQMALNLQNVLPFGDLLTQTFMNIAETGKLSFQSLVQGLKKMLVQLAATVAAAFALNLLLGGIGVKGFAKGTGGFKKILGGLGGGGALGGLIPFASGGIVSGPTPALVGEYTGARTNPEVIAPLSKLQNMMGGNVTFTISGDNLVGTLNRANKTRLRKF